MDSARPSMVTSALIGGAVAGVVGTVLSNVPIIKFVTCCCVQIIGGGLLAAAIYANSCRKSGALFNAGVGSKLGVITGLFYALTASILGAIVWQFIGAAQMAQAVEQLRNTPDMPDGLIRFFERMAESPVLAPLFGFLLNLLLGPIFGAAGGALGGLAFKVAPPPAPAPPMDITGGPGAPPLQP